MAHVDVAAVLAVMKGNTEKAQRLVHNLAEIFPREHPPCPIGSDTALDVAIITAPEARDPALCKSSTPSPAAYSARSKPLQRRGASRRPERAPLR